MFKRLFKQMDIAFKCIDMAFKRLFKQTAFKWPFKRMRLKFKTPNFGVLNA